jgi:DNA-binding Lrp family transcriptional regulator
MGAQLLQRCPGRRAPLLQHGFFLAESRWERWPPNLESVVADLFLLIQTDPGRVDDLAVALAAVEGVVTVAVTSGPYDVIAHVEAGDELAAQRVLSAVRTAPGLCRLCVCRPWSDGRQRMPGLVAGASA